MLSANKEIPIKILGIEKGNEYEDIISRDEFLEISKNDLKNVYEPIKLILERNNISIERISQIEFIGGGHRIPKIKEIINEFITENKMGVHTNGDDVISLGAGIYTSNLLGMNQSIKGMKKKYFWKIMVMQLILK
jgi:molecular chaperone DnaK (HSP70)